MAPRAARVAPPGAWAELLGLLLMTWVALAAIPIGLGGIGLSWDALNHHMYLGWTAGEPRFDRDFLAASYQAYQYPYLYWPAYQLMRLGASGTLAGVVLVSLNLLVVPALWLATRVCIPERSWHAAALRIGAVALGLSGQVSLSLTDNTANDMLAAIPLVWAVALALMAADSETCAGRWTPARLVMLSGFAAGLSVAFKFSNGPLAILMPLLWLLPAGSLRARLLLALRGGILTIAGFLLAYGYWGWELWSHFGNPMYPFYDNVFAPLRAALGWGAP